MPNIEVTGHFAVVSSIASKAGWTDGKGVQIKRNRVGLLEIDPSTVVKKLTAWNDWEPMLRIDKRCKGVKKVLFVSQTFNVYAQAGYHMHHRMWNQLLGIAKELEHLWPCHMLSRHYPKE